MDKIFELNPWLAPLLGSIAVLVFVLGVFALLCVLFGAWLLRTAVRARKILGIAAAVAVPGKSGKAKFAFGLLFANLLSGIGGRIRKGVSPNKKKPTP